jgi:flagellar basal body-associated protein FliL
MEKKEKRKLIFVTVLIVIAVIALLMLFKWLWENVFSFNMSTVATYVQTAAAAYSDPVSAAVIINQQIKAILDNPDQIEAVKFAAIQNSVSNEQQLVNSAVALATTYGYL